MNKYQTNHSFLYLERCCQLVVEKTGKPAISEWTNRDYINLSHILYRKTDVQISASTLKRIFGKLKTKDRYYPQAATRDALTQYIGFVDWEDFVENSPIITEAEKNEAPLPGGVEKANASAINQIKDLVIPAYKDAEEKPVNERIRKKAKISLPVWIAAAVIISIVVFLAVRKSSTDPMPGQVHLICIKPEGEAPHTTTFKLDLPEKFAAAADNFTIEFGDGHTASKITPSSSVSHYYEVPGRFYARLRYKGEVYDTVAVYLKSAGWTATAFTPDDTIRVYPVQKNDLGKKGRLEISAEDVRSAGVDTSRTFFVYFANARPLNIDGDNFELVSRLTTSQPRPGVRCSQVNLYLFGERSSHSVIFIKPGCENWASFNFSGVKRDGKYEDLGFLGADLTSGGEVKLRVANKKVSLFVDQKLLYETQYTYPLKRIYGMQITFTGIGKVDNLVLKDLKTGEVFSDGLDKVVAEK